MRSFIKNEIDAKIFHGGIEEFLYDLGKTVYLINEENIPSFKMGKNANEIPPSQWPDPRWSQCGPPSQWQ